MNTNFEYYKVFYYVAKYENLTRAAAALHTSQPSVTRTIRNLEQDLGCRLFIRSKSGMQLTPEGEALYRYVVEGCESFLKGENILSSLLNPEDGSIYISATETALHCFLFDAISAYRAHYPQVHFKLLNNSSQDSVRMVQEGRADMAIVSASIDVVQPLSAQPLYEYEDILVAGQLFSELAQGPVRLAELADYPWISLTAGSFTRSHLDTWFAAQGLTFRPEIEVDTTDMIRSAARRNLGLGFLPAAFAHVALQHGELIRIPLQEPFPRRPILLIHDTDAPESAAARQFRAFARDFAQRLTCQEEEFRI